MTQSQKAAIAEFLALVEERAEAKMLATHKLEGAHYAAMKQLVAEMGIGVHKPKTALAGITYAEKLGMESSVSTKQDLILLLETAMEAQRDACAEAARGWIAREEAGEPLGSSLMAAIHMAEVQP